MCFYCMIDMDGLAHNTCGTNVFIMQIDYVKILSKEDVDICYTHFTTKMEQNSHGTSSRWTTYKKRLFPKDLEV
jgi:hypothetical protein